MEEELQEQVLSPLQIPKPVFLVPGGAERRDSVAAGLAALPPEAGWVLVHDGARPNPSPEMLERLLRVRGATRAALPVLPVTDTLKQVDEKGFVLSTVDRSPLRRAQTPQLFEVDLLRQAHSHSRGPATDDAQLVEALGVPVLTVEGDPGNIKLTVPGDLAILEYWMSKK
jgi:2-C-methyl-D-erythritol 4-phosphate cytidylyltransferase